MSNPTSNFNWQMPTNVDLVTDLPADFEVFGQAVDTSLADLKGGTTGQILSKATNTDMDFTWITNDVGDITAVTAGTGITGGGASGAVTVSFDQANYGGGQYAAGKNKIINGDFSINQRNFTSVTADDYGFDRWQAARSGATLTYTPQTFTPGTAPVAGYESKNFARLAVTVGNDLARLQNKIEDVRTFAGQTVTVSFWAKGTNPTTAGNLAVNFAQNFGTGGSPSASVNTAQQTFVLTANWTRYSLTFAIPSISGKTIGTDANSSALQLWIGQGTSIATDAWTLDLWGVQVEAGSTATPFQTASGGSPQAELAMCQRYYYRLTGTSTYGMSPIAGIGNSTTATSLTLPTKVTMRIAPTMLDWSGVKVSDDTTATAVTALTINATNTNPDNVYLTATVASGLTQYRPYMLNLPNATTNYIGWSAEL